MVLRMLQEKGSLWYRVCACYGEVRGRLCVGEGEGRCGGRRQEVANGSSTLFWKDPWLDGESLEVRFHRLFELAYIKLATVAEMFTLGWDVNGEAWKWCRRLFAWERELIRGCVTPRYPKSI
ncbi:hypothetical protein MTR_1g068995 [Medicago truncatula]|uniref:Receptor-like kinase n=1 Tax=Medicago truncatula TaxID=3880 RepID=A0A072VKU1_MEDTR|nr:hypothetical protein MTR_1g068995 [Medicago truncatula]